MPHVITNLCLREGSCATVCPVECIVPGKPQDEWSTFVIDAETCIDCGACAAECPFNAIFPDVEVPSAYKAKGGEYLNMPAGTHGFETVYEGKNRDGEPIHLASTKILKPGEVVDLTPAISNAQDFFKDGPGYNAAK